MDTPGPPALLILFFFLFQDDTDYKDFLDLCYILPAIFSYWDEWFCLFPQPRKASQECTIWKPASDDQNILFSIFPSEKRTAGSESPRPRFKKGNSSQVSTDVHPKNTFHQEQYIWITPSIHNAGQASEQHTLKTEKQLEVLRLQLFLKCGRGITQNKGWKQKPLSVLAI